MDAAWFKGLQRRKGLTITDLAEALGRDRNIMSRFYTGRQKPTFEQVEIVARMLDAPLSEALVRAGVASESAAKATAPGFSEGDAALWVPPNDAGASHDKELAQAFGAGAGRDVWTVKTRAMQLAGYLPGDRVLVDSHLSDSARSGDVVVAQAYDLQSGSARTLLRQYQRPALVAHSTEPDDWRVYLVDDETVAIRGVVTAAWRLRAA